VDGGGEGVHRPPVGDVDGHDVGGGLRCGSGDAVGDLGELLRTPCGEDDVPAVDGECGGGRFADAGGRAGDDGEAGAVSCSKGLRYDPARKTRL
jgi:hypothetical protein